jgi:DNA primase
MSSVIDEIKARIDIVDLVSETVQLRRSGKNYTGFCPFHSNTRTPAFAVFQDTGTWRCFGECNEGGDIIGYIMKKEGWDFAEALRFLADKAGVQLKPPTPAEQAAAEEHDNLRQLLEDAVTFFRHQLLNTPPGRQALEYLMKRGLKDDTIEGFGLGYAPNSWEALTSHFRSRRVSERELLEAGLVSERESGGVHDRFRHRITFPIRDERGRMAGFGARILNPEDVPKFLNSPQTPVFDKGRLLYGLDRARKAIRAGEQAVIVEGYLDVIALHQAGFEQAVSPMGTALTEYQMRLLKRLAHRIVLALDADAAGDKATLRGLQVARASMDHESEAVFDARGLIGYEARLQADIRVTALPPGMDPDEVVNRDPQEWQKLVEQAKPVVMHVMETLAASRDVSDPKVKSEIAAQVMPLIQDVPSAIERDTYRQSLARLLRVDERRLPAESGFTRRPAQRSRTRASTQPALEPLRSNVTGSHALEAFTLGVLLRRPDLLYRVDRELLKFSLQRLAPDDFQHADHQAILRLLQESVDQDVAEPLNHVLNRLSLPMMEVADDLLARTEKLDPNDERVLGDLLRALLDMRKSNLAQSLEFLRFAMEDSQQQGDLGIDQYQQSLAQNMLLLQRLDQARGFYTGRALHSR